MTQCCYRTHRENSSNFPKIDAVAISQLLRGNSKGISNQYSNATGEHSKIKKKNHDEISSIESEMHMTKQGVTFFIAATAEFINCTTFC